MEKKYIVGNSPTFRVLLQGVQPHVTHSEVKSKLAILFKATIEQMDKVLESPGYVLKKGASLEVATQYKSAIETTGGVCEIVSELKVVPLSIDFPSPLPAEPSKRDDSNDSRSMIIESENSVVNGKLPIDRRSSTSPASSYGSSIQSASNRITDKLGLEKIEGFSIATFFSEVFSKHHPEEVERLLSVGTPDTTPKLSAAMGSMPNPWIFFRVLSGTIIAYLVFLFGWHTYANVNLVPGLIIVGSFAVPFSILILFFELNTPKNISIIKIVELVVIGGSMSLLLSLFLFEFMPLLGVFGASAAGFVEEIGKLGALLFVMRNVSRERYRFRVNALLLGAAIGTGFAAFESAGYALRIGLVNSEAMLDNIQLRGAMSPFAHIAWSSIAASAFWIARPNHNNIYDTVTSSQFLKIFSIPVALHFVWNLPFQGPFFIKYIALGFIAWVVIISLVQSGLRELSEATTKNEAV